MGHKVVSFTDDSDSKKVYGNSFDEKVSSLNSFVVIMSDDGIMEGRTKVLIPSPVLSDVKIRAARLIREHDKDSV